MQTNIRFFGFRNKIFNNIPVSIWSILFYFSAITKMQNTSAFKSGYNQFLWPLCTAINLYRYPSSKFKIKWTFSKTSTCLIRWVGKTFHSCRHQSSREIKGLDEEKVLEKSPGARSQKGGSLGARSQKGGDLSVHGVRKRAICRCT